jgi:hypothetical protein
MITTFGYGYGYGYGNGNEHDFRWVVLVAHITDLLRKS